MSFLALLSSCLHLRPLLSGRLDGEVAALGDALRTDRRHPATGVTSGGWILIYLSNTTKRTRTPRGGTHTGGKNLSTGKDAFIHNRQKMSAQEEVLGMLLFFETFLGFQHVYDKEEMVYSTVHRLIEDHI